jgi:acyl-CoA reductase-like NAD-dependent aldehyde dehydrogenase
LSLALRAHERLEVGAVLVNQVPTFRVENMPYGGIKDKRFLAVKDCAMRWTT